MIVWGPDDLAPNDIKAIRAKNQSKVTPFESSVDRTMEALDVFAAQTFSLIQHLHDPEFQDRYDEIRRDHAVRINEAVLGINRRG